MKRMFSTLNLNILTQWMTLLSILCTFVDASPIGLVARDNLDTFVPTNGPFNISIQGAIVGVVAIVTGIYFCFFGYRFFKLTMFLSGFWLFANITYLAASKAGASDTVTLIASLIVGLLVGGIFACCWHYGLYVLGALAGYVFALWILALKIGGLIESHVGRSLFIAGVVIGAVVLMYFFERFAVVLATSLVGAFLVMFGIDVFAHTGFAATIKSFLDGGKVPYENVDAKIYIMLVCTAVLALIGVFAQYRFHWGRRPDARQGNMRPYGYERLGRKG